jgi:hypothetical protein
MSNESSVQKKIWQALSPTSTLFRLNTGKAWTGSAPPQRLSDGSIFLPGARPISLGFCFANTDPVVGAADLIGYTTIEITQDMVGKKMAIFTSIECKNSNGGHKLKEQQHWMNNIRMAGGIAGFAKSTDEALSIIKNYIRK